MTDQQPDTPDLAEILFEYENGQNPYQSEDYKFDRTKAALDRYYYSQALEAVKIVKDTRKPWDDVEDIIGNFEAALAIQFNQKGK